MSSRSEAEMSQAVRDCVTSCLEASLPRDCIYEFVRVLVDERGWPEADADQVARSATDVVRTIAPHLVTDQGD
jgi:hypothetical protein